MNEIMILSLVCCVWPLVVHMMFVWFGRARTGELKFRSPVVRQQRQGFTGSGQKPKS